MMCSLLKSEIALMIYGMVGLMDIGNNVGDIE